MNRMPTASIIRPTKSNTERVYCATCSHHSTFHQLVTRDKWALFDPDSRPTITHQIPWFCEYLIENQATGEEAICGCNKLVPVTMQEVSQQIR